MATTTSSERLATGKVDWSYLQSLCADAVPVLAALPSDVVGCALTAYEPSDDDWLEWNLGRQRAEPLPRSVGAGFDANDADCLRQAAD